MFANKKKSTINLVMLCCLWTDALLLESVYTPKGYPEFESRSLRKVTRYKSARFKRVTFIFGHSKLNTRLNC